ncbi:Zinc finger CCCH domain-containing protein 19 [Acorus calamus]|uniref:Zinc finger CCCH domain-containing protein 19 n=1 Tax=Acorus calamus TaxID=4465 RepID=A0AAV9F423_ACOCL|nr:Zinc finger CCCH domain-containing protein 19 [Acorus calamus]
MELVGREQSTRPSTVNDEEAVKKNTDCIYFLASPLTCKKGNECEYRHSENARMNPRDCFYWLNRNCLNPKCSFRHPPLDPLVGTPLSTSSSGHFPLVQSALPAQVSAVNVSASHNPNKQNVPCIFFQKGFCLKGDKCPFMHGPQPTSNPLPQQTSPFVAPEQPLASKKATTWEHERCGSQQKLPQANIHKFVQALPMAQSVIKAESLSVSGAKKNMPLPRLDEGHPRINQAHVPVVNNNTASRTASHHVPPQDDHYPNGRSLGEFRVESSPGFNVRQKREHFHVVDGIGRERNRHGRSKSSEFDHCSSDHDSLPISKREMYAVRSDYDQFSLEQRRPSSERILERPPLPERRGYLRGENPDHIDQLDLRHRLAKKTKFNGSRSILTPESRGEYHRGDAQRDEDRRIRGHSFRDRPPLASEGSISNRLQGRIKLPGVPSTDDPIDLHVERDIDRVRSRRRMSPPSRTIKSHQEREHDRIKRRGEELATEGRNSSDFAAPKTLAELKGTKASEGIQETSSHTNSSARSTMNITDRLGKSLDHQDSESSLSFEGPKPLSMILKRKRETTSENGELSGNDAEEHRRQGENLVGTEATESEKGALDAEKPDLQAVEEEEKEEGLFTVEGEDEYHNVQYSFSKAEKEQEMDDSNMMEDGDAEAYEEGDGEFEYEQVEGGEDADVGHEEEYYEEIEGGEDADVGHEEEYFDDDDEDDFAKKVGISLS